VLYVAFSVRRRFLHPNGAVSDERTTIMVITFVKYAERGKINQ
jgi:hypothetical protein